MFIIWPPRFLKEKEGLENCIRSFMTRPGLAPHLLCPQSVGKNTVHGANLTVGKAGKSYYLVGPGKKETIWWTQSSVSEFCNSLWSDYFITCQYNSHSFFLFQKEICLKKLSWKEAVYPKVKSHIKFKFPLTFHLSFTTFTFPLPLRSCSLFLNFLIH